MRISVMAVLGLCWALGACGGGGSASSGDLTVSPSSVTVAVGGTTDVTAAGVTPIDRVVWSSADPSIATVTMAGESATITGVSSGQTTIDAQLGALHSTVEVTVAGTKVDSIMVTAALSIIPLGQTTQLMAQGHHTDGAIDDVTQSAAWTAQDPAIATVDRHGVVTAHAVGATMITAARDGVMGSLAIMVSDGELTAISVTPTTHTLPKGLSIALVASGTFADGNILNVTAMATWASSDEAIATVSAAGVVQSVALGSATITATVNGLSASSAIDVGAPSVTALTIAPQPLIVLVGTDQPLTVSATLSDGTTQDVSARATWNATGAAATVSAKGVVHGVASGNATITATVDGVQAMVLATVQQGLRLLVGPSNDTPIVATLAQQQRLQLSAVVATADGGAVIVTASATWTSSNPAVASVVAGRVDTQSQTGTTTVTASAAGFSVPVTVNVTSESCHPVINEVLPDGQTPSDEWIELYNACTHAVDVTGWTLVYHGPTSTSVDVPLVTLSGSMAPAAFRLYAGVGYTGTGAASADGVWPGAGGLVTGPSFGVGLLAPTSGAPTLVSGVAFGTVVANPFLEGSAAPDLPISNASGARFPFDGKDSHDGHADFSTLIPSPRAPNIPSP